MGLCLSLAFAICLFLVCKRRSVKTAVIVIAKMEVGTYLVEVPGKGSYEELRLPDDIECGRIVYVSSVGNKLMPTHHGEADGTEPDREPGLWPQG